MSSRKSLATSITINLLLFLLLLVLSPPLGKAGSPSLREVTDLTGRSVMLPAEPVRLVSLAPGITEIVFALERGDFLLGTTQYSNYPDAARNIPRIGSYVKPDLERIVALRPDLVLATRDGNPLQTISRLESMGIPVFAIDPRNLAEIKASILALGEVLNAGEKAAALAADMDSRLTHLRQQAAMATNRPLVFFQVDASPIVSVGDQTFIAELIELAGGRNAAAGSNPYPRYGWEDILRMQPEVVIITSMGGGLSPEELLSAWRRWPQLQAVENNRVYVVDADLFDRPTHRLLDGLEILLGLIQEIDY